MHKNNMYNIIVKEIAFNLKIILKLLKYKINLIENKFSFDGFSIKYNFLDYIILLNKINILSKNNFYDKAIILTKL